MTPTPFMSPSSSLLRKPIVIVGGGPSGLFLSILLSRYGVPSLLFESSTVEARFRHPQAHFLNTRTMEIFRHAVPDVYQKVKDAMPPVEQWKYFRFGANMKDSHAVVVEHPVDRPLQEGVDANGVLAGEGMVNQKERKDLSPVSVGHLAQHTLGKILYKTAQEEANTNLHFSMKVESVNQKGDGVWIQTANGSSYDTDLCIGTDGAHSTIRRNLRVSMQGQEAIQHLINIHVRLPSQSIHDNKNHGMLYSVFTPEAVAMVVCHDIGEYIIQIPYFPPFQTVQEDFGQDRLGDILESIFGERVDPSCVLSVKPWTMGALVAETFVCKNIVLAGDAAHIFPPAGGLGMNTGLQDVHNLAWKIAMGIRSFECYDRERRPVAERNAALSVRNYKRLLQVTESAYLDKRHPEILQQVLKLSPLPMSMQRQTFRTLLRAALYPFSWLKQAGSNFGRHIRSNIKAILRSGAGLPLLFPNYEIGFCYGECECKDSEPMHWRTDSLPDSPSIRVGALVPHAVFEVLAGAESFKNLQPLHSPQHHLMTISSVDLPMQMGKPSSCPNFVLLYHLPDSVSAVTELKNSIEHEMSLSLNVAVIVDSPMNTSVLSPMLQLRSLRSTPDLQHFGQPGTWTALIRPDGHVLDHQWVATNN